MTNGPCLLDRTASFLTPELSTIHGRRPRRHFFRPEATCTDAPCLSVFLSVFLSVLLSV